MKPPKEENTVYCVQQVLKKLKVKVTSTSVKEFLLTHPDYPSLKSVCDGLKKWKIEYYPLQLEKDEIKELEPPFIAHLNITGGQFAFIEKSINNQITYSVSNNDSRIESFEKFAEKLSGAVLIMDAGTNSGEKQFTEKRQNEILDKYLYLPGLVTVFLFIACNLLIPANRIQNIPQIQFWLFVGTLILGLFASVFLVLHEFRVHTTISEKICGFSSKTDCDAVLASNASRLFGWINWADAGLIWFTGILIYLTAGRSSSFGLLALVSLLSVPYPVFSIWYQAVKLKKWCPFCLMVQLALVAGFAILSTFPGFTISFADVLWLILSINLPATIWIIFKRYFSYKTKYEQEQRSLFEIKRDPDYFIHSLTKQDYREFIIRPDSLILGNQDAPVTLTAFLSPYCSPCASAFKQLKELLDNSGEIKINAVFSVYNDEQTFNLINILYWINKEQGSQGTIDFLNKWYSLPGNKRKNLLGMKYPEDFDVALKIRDKNDKLFKQNQINGTPAVFINGYRFTGRYKYIDLEYFIDKLKEIKLESKRQEAYVNSDELLPACLPLAGLPLSSNPDRYREKGGEWQR